MNTTVVNSATMFCVALSSVSLIALPALLYVAEHMAHGFAGFLLLEEATGHVLQVLVHSHAKVQHDILADDLRRLFLHDLQNAGDVVAQPSLRHTSAAAE